MERKLFKIGNNRYILYQKNVKNAFLTGIMLKEKKILQARVLYSVEIFFKVDSNVNNFQTSDLIGLHWF